MREREIANQPLTTNGRVFVQKYGTYHATTKKANKTLAYHPIILSFHIFQKQGQIKCPKSREGHGNKSPPLHFKILKTR